MSLSREKQINIQKQNYSVIGNEFDNMRDRFEVEMKRVEEEMGRLRREFEGYTPKLQTDQQQQQNGGFYEQQQQRQTSPYSTMTSSQQSSTTRGAASSPFGAGQLQQQHEQPPAPLVSGRPRYDPYLDNLKSPLIKDESDGKTLRLRFNVSQYTPEEVTVKTVDNRLLVQAKHEEKTSQRTVYREYNQEFMLPRGTDPETITSTLSTDGVLTVQAPLPAIEPPRHKGHSVQIVRQ